MYVWLYPTIEGVQVFDNYTSPCGAGVSVEHLGQPTDSVLFLVISIFRDNRTQITGSAVDLLHGSFATMENCLFVGNVSNMGVDYVGMLTGGEYLAEHGSGALTVFAGSKATVSRVYVHAQLERRGRQRHGQHLRGQPVLEQHAGGWHRTRCPGRTRHHGRFWRAGLLHPRSDERLARHDQPRHEQVRFAYSRFDERFAPREPRYAAAGYRPTGSLTSIPESIRIGALVCVARRRTRRVLRDGPCVMAPGPTAGCRLG